MTLSSGSLDAAAPSIGAPSITLRAELRDDAPWVATPRPRLSWVVETDAPGWVQAHAELRSGAERARIDGRDSVLVAWPFDDLLPGERRTVTVRAVATDGRETGWSEPLQVASAVTDWQARPIALADPDTVARPALLRTTFDGAGVTTALLHYAALGVTEVTLNGEPVDDVVLAPGWTSYQHRVVYETVDVTHLLADGENVLGARLAGGWYTESYHVLTKPRRFYGDQPRLLAQLHLEHDDGTATVLATGSGADWLAIADPATLTSGIYDGEQVDAREELRGWRLPGFDAAGWPTAAVTHDRVHAEPRAAAPVRRLETVPARKVLRSANGPIVDFGVNLVGRLRIRVRGEPGTTITIRHAEVLDDGELALRPLRLAKATDTYVLSGKGEETWEPSFTFHGFRYAQLEGWPGELDLGAVDAVVLGSDLRRTGWFRCSEPLLNTFHDNVVRTTRGNYLSVPMDCPQRDERLGWTGDTQLFAPTAAFLFDCAAFYTSWLRDLALEQRDASGLVPLFAPNVLPDFATRNPVAAWGDAMVIVPHVLHNTTGDVELLRELYPRMLDWLEVVLAARDADGLWTAGRQLGDWLDPNAPPNAPARGRTDTEILATAYVVRSARLAAEVGRLLGDDDGAARLEAEAEISRRAYVATYVTPGGRMMCDTQTAYAVTLAFELLDDDRQRDAVGSRLADVVRRDGYHIATGLIGTSVIAQALTDSGHLDAAERLLLQTESPSWLYPVTVGATTVWERWDGLRPDGSLNPGAMVSFNHVALGSVAAWLHEQVAGLTAIEPGYRRIGIEPRVLRGLEHASAEHETPYGRAASGWRREGTEIVVDAVIPANTTALVRLPDGSTHDVHAGRHSWRVADAPHPQRPQVSLDSSMADLADDPRAYAAFHEALAASPNRFVAAAVRSNALYRDSLRIRDALIFADQTTLDGVATALACADVES